MLPLHLLVAGVILTASCKPRPNNRASSLVMADRVWVERTPVCWNTIPSARVARYLKLYFEGATSEATLGDVFFVWHIPAAVIHLVRRLHDQGRPDRDRHTHEQDLAADERHLEGHARHARGKYPTIDLSAFRAYDEIP